MRLLGQESLLNSFERAIFKIKVIKFVKLYKYCNFTNAIAFNSIMNKRKSIPKSKGGSSEFSLNEYFGKDVFEKAAELYDYIKLPVFRKIDTGISGRHFQWWTEEGVLEENNHKAGRLTFVEFVWVKMVEQLRLFNVPLPYIAGIRPELFDPIEIKGLADAGERMLNYIDNLAVSKEAKKGLLNLIPPDSEKKPIDIQVGILELVLLESILKRKSVSFAFFPQGQFLIIDKAKKHLMKEADLNRLNNEHHIRINTSKIISEFLSSDLAFNTVPKIQLLTYPENKLYEAIRLSEYESITVHFRNKKIKSLELKRSESVQKKMMGVIDEGAFSEIIVKKHNGAITKVEQNIKLVL